MRYIPFLVFALFILPVRTDAALLINEIAWMGSAESANDEWIELYNDGAAIDVNGWVITDNVSLSIELEGSIASEAYVVLERTDDDSSPAPAFLIYSGALSNEGRTLTLKRTDGSVADQVYGGDGWSALGGNNETKDTPQLTSSGWITAAPTPGKTNSTLKTAGVELSEATVSENTDTGGGISHGTKIENVRISLTQPDTELILTLPERVTTHVGRPVRFEVAAGGIGTTLIESLTYVWNFGDGEISTNKSPTHTYAYAGTYVTIVEASFAHHTAYAQVEVVVLPLNLTLDADGKAVRIGNRAAYTTDISGMVLSNGKDTYQLLQNTMLAARGTLTLPLSKIGFAHTNFLVLIDTEGNEVAHFVTADTITPQSAKATQSVTQFQKFEEPPEPAVESAATTATTAEAVGEKSSTTALQRPQINDQRANPASSRASLPLGFLGLFGVLVLSIGALYSVRLS